MKFKVLILFLFLTMIGYTSLNEVDPTWIQAARMQTDQGKYHLLKEATDHFLVLPPINAVRRIMCDEYCEYGLFSVFESKMQNPYVEDEACINNLKLTIRLYDLNQFLLSYREDLRLPGKYGLIHSTRGVRNIPELFMALYRASTFSK